MFDLDAAIAEQIAEHASLIGRITAIKDADPILLQPVIDAATECWRDGDDLYLVHRWLMKPLVTFEHLMPLEMAALGRGQEVIDHIFAARNGVYQ